VPTWLVVLAVSAAPVVLVAGQLAWSASPWGWKAQWRSSLVEAAGDLARTEPLHAEGNSACFDVCRSVWGRFRAEADAETTTHELAGRLTAAGWSGVTQTCEQQAWCTVSAVRAGLTVYGTQPTPGHGGSDELELRVGALSKHS
jgi:hypothetical protein